MITKTDILFVVAKLQEDATASNVRKELAILESREKLRSLAEIVARISRLEKEGALASRLVPLGSEYRQGTKVYRVTKEGKRSLIEFAKKAERMRELPSIAANLADA